MQYNNSRNKTIYLSLKNHGGSVEHYFHFLLGFLIPLVLEQKKIREKNCFSKIFIRSCAIMDKHILDIQLKDIHIIKNEDLSQSCTEKVSTHEYIERCGYDDPAHYHYNDFRSAELIISNFLSNDIARFRRELKSNLKTDDPNVIIINREPSNSFFHSDECEIKTSGTDRRSIRNIHDLCTAVKSRYRNTTSVTLEGKSLAYQVALFQHADIIIAQHGAALANLIWCKDNTTLVEIYPQDLPSHINNKDYFQNLAKCTNIKYHRVAQKHEHSDVDISLLLSTIQNTKKTQPHIYGNLN